MTFHCEEKLIQGGYLPTNYERSLAALEAIVFRLNEREMELWPSLLSIEDAIARSLARAAIASMNEEARTTSTNPPGDQL